MRFTVRSAEGRGVDMTPRASYPTIREAQCAAEGWNRFAEQAGRPPEYRAVEHDDDGAVTTVYPRKDCPHRS